MRIWISADSPLGSASAAPASVEVSRRPARGRHWMDHRASPEAPDCEGQPQGQRPSHPRTAPALESCPNPSLSRRDSAASSQDPMASLWTVLRGSQGSGSRGGCGLSFLGQMGSASVSVAIPCNHSPLPPSRDFEGTPLRGRMVLMVPGPAQGGLG